LSAQINDAAVEAEVPEATRQLVIKRYEVEEAIENDK